uniref:Uncharacterized protein n=1 Tax=Arundo donax TaxID=35708 RepID=A0A0A9DBK1_ARUDO
MANNTRNPTRVSESDTDAECLTRQKNLDTGVRVTRSITNSIETVLKCNVEVKMGPLAELISEELTLEAGPKIRRVDTDVLSCSSNSDRLKGTLNSSRRTFDHPNEVKKELEKYKNTPTADERLQSVSITASNSGISKARGLEVPNQMSKLSINDEQRLESAWLQAVEKQAPGVMNQAGHDRNPVLSQVESQFQRKSSMSLVVPSSHADGDLAHEIEALKIVDSYGPQKHQNRRSENGYAISPSKLHSNDDMANCDKESICSEPGRPGCHGLFPCWKAQKPKGIKVKRDMRVKSS